MKNTELAYKTLDYIREHPQDWNQLNYFCGTTACFAGRAILIALGFSTELEFRQWQQDNWDCTTTIVAQRLLGWTPREAHHVFASYTRDFTVLETAVKEVLNGEVQQ